MKPAAIKTDSAFAGAVAGGPKLVLFYSRWCPFCLSFMPAFESLAGEAGTGFLLASVDDLPEAEERHAIEVVPTVLFFQNGRETARLDGALGRGLSAVQLGKFADSCLKGGKK